MNALGFRMPSVFIARLICEISDAVNRIVTLSVSSSSSSTLANVRQKSCNCQHGGGAEGFHLQQGTSGGFRDERNERFRVRTKEQAPA